MEGDAASAVCLRGTPVSPGFARGALVVLADDSPATRRSGSAEDEPARLRAAIARARNDLARLAERLADGEAQTILAFQVAMLDDAVVTDPAFASIARGEGAEDAWRAAMQLQIAEFHEAEDLYFRARASDLRDMRDRVLRCLAGTAPQPIAPGSIVVANDLAPSRFLEIAWADGGLALRHGSPNSHLAMLARARAVPMLIGLGDVDLQGHADALIDTDMAALVVSPDAAFAASFASRQRRGEIARADAERYARLPAVTADGQRVDVLVNVADGRELEHFDPACCDGIGLVRTELMLADRTALADEESQYQAYRRIVLWARGRPVSIRTLDAGGDKPIPGYTIDNETNPFLGMRGIRLSLAHPDIFTVQLRALARAAALGPLKVMLPMVTSPREVDRARALLEGAVAALRREGVECAAPALGIMVEVPAAALAIDLFDVDFLSIGSNDLVQYVTGTSRDSNRHAPLQDPLQPAMLRLMREVVAHASRNGIPVSLCGDMAADARCIAPLLDLGLRSLSVPPAGLARVKRAIANHAVGTTK